MQNFNENFIFFAKRHCLLLFTQQRVTVTCQWSPYIRHH